MKGDLQLFPLPHRTATVRERPRHHPNPIPIPPNSLSAKDFHACLAISTI